MKLKTNFKGQYFLATLAGIISILLWASNIAFSKSVMDKEGILLASCYIYIFSAILIWLLLPFYRNKPGFIGSTRNLPMSFHLKTGIFFIVNNVFLLIAIGLARKNEELIIVTLLNYTWPIMIYIIGIPLLRLKIPLKMLLPGIILSFSGITLALLQGYNSEDIGRIMRAGNDNILAYFLAFCASVSWATYSNLTAKYRSSDDLAGIPIVFFASGLIFLIMLGIKGGLHSFRFDALFRNPELAYMIAGPTSMGYLGWYFAIKRGNKNLVTSLSFFIPLLSLLIIHFRFNIPITFLFWLAVLLLTAGSYLCYRSFRKK